MAIAKTIIPILRVPDFLDQVGVCSVMVQAADGEMLDGSGNDDQDNAILIRNMISSKILVFLDSGS